MRLREHSPAILLWLAALMFAVLAGVAIPLLSGRSTGPSAANWTPPPTATIPAATARSAATQVPTVLARTIVPQSTSTPAPSMAAKATAASTATPSAAPVAGGAEPTRALTASISTPARQAMARIVRGPVNLRAGPGTTFAVLGTAKNGDEMSITGRSEDGRWVRLCCVAGAPAWAATELTELPAPVESIPVAP
ncbi:MAG: SH3 domain-containing protein [Nitrososphaerales archaeon]